VPREKWRELMLARRRFLEIKLSYDCRCQDPRTRILIDTLRPAPRPPPPRRAHYRLQKTCRGPWHKICRQL